MIGMRRKEDQGVEDSGEIYVSLGMELSDGGGGTLSSTFLPTSVPGTSRPPLWFALGRPATARQSHRSSHCRRKVGPKTEVGSPVGSKSLGETVT